MNKFTILALLAAVVLVVVLFLPAGSDEFLSISESPQDFLSLSDVGSTTQLQVVGIVKAADTAVISAETSGVLQSLLVSEGDVVSVNEVVALQSTPVADAQVAYRVAQDTLTGTEQAAAVDARQYAAEKAAIVARSADVIAVIQTEAAESQLQAETAAVRTATEVGVTTMLDTLMFVNEHPSLFADSRRVEFRSIVTDLYGSLPNHFSTSVRYAADTNGVDVMRLLESLRTVDVSELSVVDVETLSVVVMGQMRALQNLYATAEADVLDQDTISRNNPLYTTYFDNRSQLNTTLAALEGKVQSLQQRIDNLAETNAATYQTVAVSDLDEALAARQYTFSANIAAAADAVASAATAVAVAEQSLGVVTAPFKGTVSNVYANMGEFVAAGQPLFTLHGTGARELEVNVPVAMATTVTAGDAFYIDNVPAGVVDRVQVGETGHSITVFISLLDTSMAVGTSIRGELVLTMPIDTVTLPREYVFFGVSGAFVRSSESTDYAVDVVSDNGEQFVVRFVTEIPAFAEFVPNHGISF